MMISSHSVLERLRQLTALDSEGAAEALPLCALAAIGISERARVDADLNDERLLNAAAACAFNNLTLLRTVKADDPESFKAGDITVKKNCDSNVRLASKLMESMMLEAAPLLKDTAFGFLQV
ncbi:MAG: hypothetical protein GX851_08320 [Clostridiales bacterium]|nr:hypothetical protein [Clostridiales bacterium]